MGGRNRGGQGEKWRNRWGHIIGGGTENSNNTGIRVNASGVDSGGSLDCIAEQLLLNAKAVRLVPCLVPLRAVTFANVLDVAKLQLEAFDKVVLFDLVSLRKGEVVVDCLTLLRQPLELELRLLLVIKKAVVLLAHFVDTLLHSAAQCLQVIDISKSFTQLVFQSHVLLLELASLLTGIPRQVFQAVHADLHVVESSFVNFEHGVYV